MFTKAEIVVIISLVSLILVNLVNLVPGFLKVIKPGDIPMDVKCKEEYDSGRKFSYDCVKHLGLRFENENNH